MDRALLRVLEAREGEQREREVAAQIRRRRELKQSKEKSMDAAFEVHFLNDQGKAKAKKLAETFDALLTEVKSITPAGRCLALVTTHLEQACFYAKKGMAGDKVNSEA